MKKNIIYILLALATIVSSCELDNYDAPNAKFFGSIIDEEIGGTIPQDLIDGSVVEYVELGYENPPRQQLRFKPDGTFRNNLMFSGKYAVQPVRSNFRFVESDTITIEGDTEHTFTSLPYIRVKDLELELSADSTKVTATFTLEQTGSEIVKTLLFVADKNPNVGLIMRTISTGKNVNKVVDPSTVYKLTLRIKKLEKGQQYFFRMGALIDVPEAKYNWSEAIRLGV